MCSLCLCQCVCYVHLMRRSPLVNLHIARTQQLIGLNGATAQLCSLMQMMHVLHTLRWNRWQQPGAALTLQHARIWLLGTALALQHALSSDF